MRDEAQSCEDLLARLFVDQGLRARFKRDPALVGKEFGLSESALAALVDTDWVGLDLAALSYAHKATQHAPKKRSRWFW
jgi:hypothetical protein